MVAHIGGPFILQILELGVIFPGKPVIGLQHALEECKGKVLDISPLVSSDQSCLNLLPDSCWEKVMGSSSRENWGSP